MLSVRGRAIGTETFVQRAIERAFLKVGALRTLEIVLAQLPGAVDLAATPFSAIECEHLALCVGSRSAFAGANRKPAGAFRRSGLPRP